MQNTSFRILQISFVLLCSSYFSVNARGDSSYSFIVAGHAYGSHEGTNIGLHPAFLSSMDMGYDSLAAFIILTGDIVRKSTAESWQEVENELAGYPLSTYYVMGNHDDNEIGYQVFSEKHGSAYYSFYFRQNLYIILNSTEDERSISSGQITFLQDQLNIAGDTVKSVFIFFHELLWNSHDKYIDVKSNNRSRYLDMVKYSNYWTEVHPKLINEPKKDFYLITGDVGGRADAIAAFYDAWDNVTLMASGMGEVTDENYLLVMVHENDSIEFKLQPLNSEMILPAIEHYSVPPAVDTISGPDLITAGSPGIKYSTGGVFNADSYQWELPAGVSGSSDSSSILADFTNEFREGTISVRASKTGFGSGPAFTKLIRANNAAIYDQQVSNSSLQLEIKQDHNFLTMNLTRIDREPVLVRLLDTRGRILLQKQMKSHDNSTLQVDKNELPAGIIFVSISSDTQQITKKIVAW